jgi:hypothetical protein
MSTIWRRDRLHTIWEEWKERRRPRHREWEEYPTVFYVHKTEEVNDFTVASILPLAQAYGLLSVYFCRGNSATSDIFLLGGDETALYSVIKAATFYSRQRASLFRISLSLQGKRTMQLRFIALYFYESYHPTIPRVHHGGVRTPYNELRPI